MSYEWVFIITMRKRRKYTREVCLVFDLSYVPTSIIELGLSESLMTKNIPAFLCLHYRYLLPLKKIYPTNILKKSLRNIFYDD